MPADILIGEIPSIFMMMRRRRLGRRLGALSGAAGRHRLLHLGRSRGGGGGLLGAAGLHGAIHGGLVCRLAVMHAAGALTVLAAEHCVIDAIVVGAAVFPAAHALAHGARLWLRHGRVTGGRIVLHHVGAGGQRERADQYENEFLHGRTPLRSGLITCRGENLVRHGDEPGGGEPPRISHQVCM